MNKLIMISSCFFILLSRAVAAPESNDSSRQHIYQAVQLFLGQKLITQENEKIEINVSNIDKRINLKHCSVPLTLSLPGNSKLTRNTTVEVKCDEHWKIYVPVRIKRLQKIVVAAQTLSTGTLLNESNLILAYHDVLTLRGSVNKNIASLTGSKIKRYVQQGHAITNNLICLVCNGEPVTIYARAGSLTIKSLGIAQRDGSVGQVIAVKNRSSGRLIQATVIAVGEVEIKL